MSKALSKRNKFSEVSIFGLLFLFVVPLVYIPSVLDSSLMPRITIFSIALISMFYYLFTTKNKILGKYAHGAVFNLPVLLLLGLFLISGLSTFVAVNKSVALSEWLVSFPVIALIILAITFISKQENAIATIIKFVAVFSIFQAAIGLIQFINLNQTVGLTHELSYYVTGLSSHRNPYSQILLLGLPFCLYGLYLFKGTWRWVSLAAAVLILGMVTVLLARSAWMAILISTAVSFLVLLNYYSYFQLGKKTLRRMFIVLASLVASVFLFVAVYASLDSWETIEKQADWMRNYRFGSTLERVDLWEKSVEIYRDHPITGIGTGNWKIVLPSYGTDGLRSSEGIIHFVRPHNDFVGILAENGIFGFLCYSGFFFVLVFYLYRLMKQPLPKDKKVLLIFLFAGLLIYFVIANLSFPRERVEHSVFLALYAAFIISLYQKHFSNQKTYGKAFTKVMLRGLVPLFLVLATVVGGTRTYSEYYMKKALMSREENKHQEVIEFADKANNYFYRLDNTSLPVRWYTASAYFFMGNYNKALEHNLMAYQSNPFNMHVLNNLATCYETLGEHEKSLKYYLEAISVSKHFEDAWLNLVAVYYNQEKWDEALDALNHIDINNSTPKYLNSRKVVLSKHLELLEHEIPEEDMKQAIHRIGLSPDWIEKVYLHALDEGVSFKQRVYNESIYTLEVLDKSISKKHAHELKEKYLSTKQ